MKRFIIITSFMLYFAGCRLTGTDTGNPATDTGNPESSKDPYFNSLTYKTAHSLCASLFKCYNDINIDSCEIDILTVVGMATDLGFTSHSTLNDVKNDADAKYNSTNLNSCLTTIDNLPCESLTMTSAYSSTSSGNYSSTYKLFEASTNCANVNDPNGILANPKSAQN